MKQTEALSCLKSEWVETGYSGSLTNKNNPDRQHDKGMGPLPRETYQIAGHSACKGPYTILEDFYQRTRLALLSTDQRASCLWFLEATYEEWKTDKARQVE
ncbi:hypothetical protein ACQK5W_08345 [Pantoea sp. FN060301]|uniref:hypothetical protein n=1 Tax=Pantoea sp. FN060301 TaxID=3420380 RepID=UPI003D181993